MRKRIRGARTHHGWDAVLVLGDCPPRQISPAKRKSEFEITNILTSVQKGKQNQDCMSGARTHQGRHAVLVLVDRSPRQISP